MCLTGLTLGLCYQAQHQLCICAAVVLWEWRCWDYLFGSLANVYAAFGPDTMLSPCLECNLRPLVVFHIKSSCGVRFVCILLVSINLYLARWPHTHNVGPQSRFASLRAVSYYGIRLVFRGILLMMAYR